MESSTENATLVTEFTERARSVAAEVSHAQDIADAARIIATARPPAGTGKYTATQALIAKYPHLTEALAQEGIDARIAEDAGMGATPSEAAAALAGDTGLVLAKAGVAETGSFLSAEEDLPARLLGMLSDTVFAILPASAILPTLDDMGELLSRLSAEGNRYLSLVTGPSRTADIERVLTIGVQGPKALHIIVIAD